MRIGMVGLGRMGASMTQRLLHDGHEIVVFDVNPEAVAKAAGGGATPATSLEDLVEQLERPRVVWLMVPAGDVTAATIGGLSPLLSEGDVIVDGGNSRYTDTLGRAESLRARGIELVDAGTSGGIWGLEEGYCLMIGSSHDAFRVLEPVFSSLAPPGGYARVGPPGSGHYVKMVHNGIEYALMQAYAEGFELMHSGEFELDLATVAELWRHGSVVRSWLLDLTAVALQKDPDLKGLSDWVDDSGEGRWTVQTAIDHAVPAPTIALSLFSRFRSRQEESFSGKLLAALRSEFGGHAVRH